MKYCSHCGAEVSRRVPPGDTHLRYVCDACGEIHYQNPLLVVGAVPEWDGRLLLCRRAIEPRYGLWTLPAGFMENGETAAEGAMREALEEARARIEIQELYTLYSVPHVNQVHMMFRARLLNEDYGAGAETLEVKLMSAEEIPWNELAFAVVRRTLEHFLADRELGTYTMRSGDILSPVR